MKKNYQIKNLEDLKNLAKEISLQVKPETVIYLNGNLGAGKTTFTQYLLSELGVKENVVSPTFTFLRIYNAQLNIYHYDFYRIDETLEDEKKLNMLEQIQFFENLNDKNGIVIVEWSVNAAKLLPQPTLSITINVNEDTRNIEIEYPTTK